MSAVRLLIFRTCCFAAPAFLLFGQQLPGGGGKNGAALVVVPANDRESIASIEQYRDSIETAGFKFNILSGEHPLVTIVDPRGAVVARYAGDSPAAFLVQRLNLATGTARSEIHGKRLELLLSASREPGGAGGRIVLAADFELKPGVHVYAPGVEGYIPIAWTLEPSADWRVRDVIYPEPETLHLAAIDETVPAFQGHFRLTREILLSPDRKGPLSVTGTLRYQACDDTMCYIPETLPLRWNIF